MCTCHACPFTDAGILQPLGRVDSHINAESRLRLGPDLLRTLCLGGMALRFESRAVSPHRDAPALPRLEASDAGGGRVEASEEHLAAGRGRAFRKPRPRCGRDPVLRGSHVGKEQKVGQSRRRWSVKLMSTQELE